MKGRTTLILMAVFLALLAYVYFGELRKPTSPEATTPTPAPLWSIAQEEVVGLTVRGDGKETRLARPTAGQWALEAPVAEPADDQRVGQLVARLAEVVPTRTLTDTATDLADYGLAQPALEIIVRLADGQSQTLRVGTANPQQSDYYAQAQGQTAVHLVPSYLIESLRELLATPPVRPTPTPTMPATATPTPAVPATPTPAG